MNSVMRQNQRAPALTEAAISRMLGKGFLKALEHGQDVVTSIVEYP
jgi:hypothetical protein